MTPCTNSNPAVRGVCDRIAEAAALYSNPIPFLDIQHCRWQMFANKLEAWAKIDDDTPHPFQNEIDAFDIAFILTWLEANIQPAQEAA